MLDAALIDDDGDLRSNGSLRLRGAQLLVLSDDLFIFGMIEPTALHIKPPKSDVSRQC